MNINKSIHDNGFVSLNISYKSSKKRFTSKEFEPSEQAFIALKNLLDIINYRYYVLIM